MSILPREIWEKIIKHINDFGTWGTIHFVSRTWRAWVLALDEEKLNEFAIKYYNGKQKWQELPNGMIHGDMIAYHFRYIKSIERYYFGKKCGISEYLMPREVFINDNCAIWTDKRIHLYENGKLSLVIALLTERKYDNQNDYTVYCPEQGIVVCIGPNNTNDIYINGNLI